jgi:hypothetical protein
MQIENNLMRPHAHSKYLMDMIDFKLDFSLIEHEGEVKA